MLNISIARCMLEPSSRGAPFHASVPLSRHCAPPNNKRVVVNAQGICKNQDTARCTWFIRRDVGNARKMNGARSQPKYTIISVAETMVRFSSLQYKSSNLPIESTKRRPDDHRIALEKGMALNKGKSNAVILKTRRRKFNHAHQGLPFPKNTSMRIGRSRYLRSGRLDFSIKKCSAEAENKT
eukprot:GEMP01074193.1.p1 GENE.GEMP01074193.1~~GEMP01074193.1.p1  ORF type:complete len:182 (-),score=31.27 GEMP01074193.1:111-656(-)